MLWELWQSLTTPAPSWSRRAGLQHQSIALEARYRRCRTDWDAHYAHCRSVIERAVMASESGGSVVVLGSGLLHDVPLSAMSQHFDRILLIDAVHTRSARRRASLFPPAELVTLDLSGAWCAEHLSWRPPADTRLIISLNVLSQLLLPVRDDEASMLKVAARHHALLGQSPMFCLISDVSWHIKDRHDATIETLDAWHGLQQPQFPPVEQWEWVMAPMGEIARDTRQVNAVSAWVGAREEWCPRLESNQWPSP